MYARVHAVDPRSRANGPGVRFVIWLQGCTLGCAGCFNPATHPEIGGSELHVDEQIDILSGIEIGKRPVEREAVEGLVENGAADAPCLRLRPQFDDELAEILLDGAARLGHRGAGVGGNDKNGRDHD